MKSVADQIVEAKVKALRDDSRPAMEAVVAVLERIFGELLSDETRITCIEAGPVSWIWKDETMAERHLDKYYVLTGSADPDVLGYPLLTIRQAYSQWMDSWISASSLISGKDEAEIMQGISLMVANHMGAFAGFRYSMNTGIANGGSARAALAGAKAISSAADGKFTISMRRDVERSVGIDEDTDGGIDDETESNRSDMN